MKKKGFTLVELIAVLVIMAVLALITVPIVFNQIESTRIESYKVSVRNVINAVSSYMAKSEGVDNFPNEGLIIPTSEYYKRLSLKNANFISGRIFLNEEGVLVAKEISDGTFCASGTKNDLDVIKGECELIDDTKPEINVMVSRVTTTSITVSVNSSDNESGITDYKYYLNGKLIAETKNNVYTFKELKPNTEYEIKVVTVNGNNLEAEQTLNVTTTTREILIDAKPEEWSHSKTVIITFTKETGYETYRYKKVGDINWISVAGNKVDFLIEQNCTIIAQILSSNGEVIIEVTKAIGSIDNDKPQIIGIIGNDEEWKFSKQIEINATDGAGSGIASYSFDDGNTWQESNTKVITEQRTINVVVKDKLGNISDVKTYEILYIDNTIPKAHSITATTSDGVYENDKWTNKTVTLTANPNPTETSSGYTYQWYEKSGDDFVAIEGATNKTLVLENETTKTYKVDIRTKAGSKPTASSNEYIVKIDQTPPSCNMQAPYTEWTKSDRTLTATCSDSASGCINDTSSKVWTYNESNKEIKTETLAYLVKDNAGNSKTCTYNDYGIYVDKKSPSLSIVSVVTKINSATIGYNSQDLGSGSAKATCVYGTSNSYGSNGTVNSDNNGCTLSDLKNNTTYYYQICVSDKVGNETVCETGNLKTSTIEKPQITSDITPTQAQNGYVKQQIAKVSYVGTGIENPRYFVKTTRKGISNLTVTRSCGGGTLPNTSCTTITGTTTLEPNIWYEVSGNVNVTYNEATSETGTLYATTYDGVGFVDPSPTATLFKIDNTSPTVTLGTSSSNGDSITVNYTLNDTESGIGSYTCKYVAATNNGYISSGNASYGTNASSVSATSCTITGLDDYTEYYYQICATDKVGNTSTCQTGAARTLDTTKPNVPTSTIRYNNSAGAVRINANSWSNQTLWWGEFNSTDEGSGIDHYDYSTNCTGTKNGTLAVSEYTYGNGTNSTYCIRAVDKAGNISSWSSAYYFKVDTTTPTVTLDAVNSNCVSSSNFNNCGSTALMTSGTWYKSGAAFRLTQGTVGVSGATIKYCKDTNNTCTPNTTVTSGASITNYSSTTGTYYIRYQITSGAGKASGIGSYQAKIDQTIPSLNVSVGSTTTSSITLNFSTSDTQSGIANVACVYGTSDSYGNNGTISYTNSNKTVGTCTMSGLSAGTTYYYKVTSTDGVDNSNKSESSKATNAAAVTSCGWELNPVISETEKTVTFTFTPTNGCTFKNVERFDTTRTYKTCEGTTPSYPLFQCSTTVGGHTCGNVTPLACSAGDYSPVSTVGLYSSSPTQYVYKFYNYHKGTTSINVKFMATFNNDKTLEINYRVSGCSVCDNTSCYTNEAFAGWQNVCK